MGKLYPAATFESIGQGDVLISIDEAVEWEVHSKHEAVPERFIPSQVVTTILRAEAGSGLAGLVGSAHILLGDGLSDRARIKKKGS